VDTGSADLTAHLHRVLGGAGPIAVVLVGPNGAGKSTFYARYLQRVALPFINADNLARTLVEAGSPAGEETERLAARLADKRRAELLTGRASFITETVFSDPHGAKVQMLRDAQAAGYAVVLIFVCVDSAELTTRRVETRVALKGHTVPPDKIRARYERMRPNVKTALPFVDVGLVIDNSSYQSPHRLVAVTERGTVIARHPPLPWWAEEVLP